MKDYKVSLLTIINDKLESNAMDENDLKIVNIVEDKGLKIVSYNTIPHRRKEIQDKLIELCDSKMTDLVLVSVSKNAHKKYIINEVTESVIEKESAVIKEKIRHYVLINTAGKIALNGVSGIRNKTLIINVPENIKSSLGFILDYGIEELEKELSK